MRDPLFENKLQALLLVAALIVFGGPLIADRLFFGNERLEQPLAVTEKPPSAEESIAVRLARANPEAGRRAIALCAACHTFGKGGESLLGPNLWGVVNRPIASVDGFYYSPALQSLEGRWTVERLDQYLENSQEFAPGTAMVQRLPNGEQRADIIKYLQSLSDV